MGEASAVTGHSHALSHREDFEPTIAVFNRSRFSFYLHYEVMEGWVYSPAPGIEIGPVAWEVVTYIRSAMYADTLVVVDSIEFCVVLYVVV